MAAHFHMGSIPAGIRHRGFERTIASCSTGWETILLTGICHGDIELSVTIEIPGQHTVPGSHSPFRGRKCRPRFPEEFDTLSSAALETTRSSFPSWSKSPATALVKATDAEAIGARNMPPPCPHMISIVPPALRSRSGVPSPLKSPESHNGPALPTGNETGGSKSGPCVAAPRDAVPSGTLLAESVNVTDPVGPLTPPIEVPFTVQVRV